MPTHLYGLPAPAKLNLFLHVTGRRADGRHTLQSVFELIDLADTVDLTLREDGHILRTGDVIGDIGQDLCVRAAEALKHESGVTLGAEIRVTKRIPAGAGLGGGSSDAATTLIGLNRLWGLNFTREQLARIGLTLGADVPFFLFGRTAWAESIGESLSPVTLPASRYVLLWPAESLSTAKIFQDPLLTRNTKSVKMAVFSDFVKTHKAMTFGRNDLQDVAMRHLPAVGHALKLLESRGWSARMTGSGSAVFAVLDDVEAFRLDKFEYPKGWLAFEARTLTEHPLYGWLGTQ